MSKSASMYIRIDPQMKSDVEAIYSQYGLSITDAINVFLHQSRNVGGLPFDLRPRYPYADELLRDAAEIDAALANGTAKIYETPEELFASWENDK